MNKTLSRRELLKTGAGALGCALLAPTVRAEAPLLVESDPMAIALTYHANADAVDGSKQPNYQAGQNCANCAQKQAPRDDGTLACNLFPGKRVMASGWCKVWSKGG